MPAETVTAQDDPELRLHPRVTDHQAEEMRLGASALRVAASRICEEPATTTRAAFEVAAGLSHFAHVLSGQIAAPADTTDRRDCAKWIIAMSSAFTSLTFCADLVPDQALDPTSCEAARSEVLDLVLEVEALAYRHPYRFFLPWWMVATSAAVRYAAAAHEVTQHQAGERACIALRMANVNAPLPVPDLSNGYLDPKDLAALCFTMTDQIDLWRLRPDFPPYDFTLPHGRGPLWRAERARDVRAWWLRHDELPVAEHPTRTPGHRIGDRWLTPAP